MAIGVAIYIRPWSVVRCQLRMLGSCFIVGKLHLRQQPLTTDDGQLALLLIRPPMDRLDNHL